MSTESGLRAALCVAACLLATSTPAAPDAAHFWLSTSSVATPGPSNASFSLTAGTTDTLYLWGRPTDGRQLRNLSLNLVADDSGLDFVDGGFTIYNSVDAMTDRFEYVQDSTAAPPLESFYNAADVSSGEVDELYGVNAFTVFDGATLRGVGPVCTSGEIGCVTAGDGDPAWLLAGFDISAITAGKTVNLRLQVSEFGMVENTIATGDYDLQGDVGSSDHGVWIADYGSSTLLAADGNGDGVIDAADYTVWRDHLGDTGVTLGVASTEVRFGADAGAGDEPKHNSLLDFDTNLAGDDPDATITITAPSMSVPEPAAQLAASLAMVLSVSVRGFTRR